MNLNNEVLLYSPYICFKKLDDRQMPVSDMHLIRGMILLESDIQSDEFFPSGYR